MIGTTISNSTIDHVLILVDDLEASKTAFERLGFLVTDRGVHSKYLGTANHCVMLRGDYFELLGVVAPTEANQGYRLRLESHQGLLGFALATSDSDKVYEAFRAQDLPIDPVKEYGRPVEVDGREEQVAFKSAFISDDPAAGPIVFFCEHKTPHLVWRPEWQDHPNGARNLARLTLVADDPRAVGVHYRTMLAPDAEPAAEEEVYAFQMGPCRFRVVSRQRATRDYPGAILSAQGGIELIGLGIGVGDLTTARNLLWQNRVETLDTAQGLQFPPHEAGGAVLEFLPA